MVQRKHPPLQRRALGREALQSQGRRVPQRRAGHDRQLVFPNHEHRAQLQRCRGALPESPEGARGRPQVPDDEALARVGYFKVPPAHGAVREGHEVPALQGLLVAAARRRRPPPAAHAARAAHLEGAPVPLRLRGAQALEQEDGLGDEGRAPVHAFSQPRRRRRARARRARLLDRVEGPPRVPLRLLRGVEAAAALPDEVVDEALQIVVRHEEPVLQDLARPRRVVVVREPALDGRAVVRVPVGGDDGHAHQRARDGARELVAQLLAARERHDGDGR
mmetsp:Transcript_18823/g.55958  ORF Transcript_18823/g.55958 Transcript_18823/m.55958 type:complete len:277 (+) Transcript_18823:382-1212(+)